MMDNRGETQPEVYKKPSFVTRKIAEIAVAGSILLSGAGCAETRTADISNNIPTSTSENVTTSGTTKLVTSEVIVTPQETTAPEATDPKVTVKPATTVGTSAETQYVTQAPTETTINAELAAAPEISGLSKEIQDRKVVYKAVEGNEYGIEVGKFAGEYNPNVSIEGAEVGAVALEPSVVDKILTDELAKIPEGENKMKVIIPLDITEVTKETGFNIKDTIETGLSEYLGKESHIMIVEFNNPLTFINPYIDKNKLNTVDGFTSDNWFKKENGEIVTLTKQAGLIPFSCFDQNNTEMGVEDVYYIFDVADQNKISTFNEEKAYTVGEKTDVQVKSVLSVWFDYYNLQGTTPNDLLKLSDGTVVFTYPQETLITETSN